LIRVMSTLVGCACTLLEAPRGPFYRHKGPRSRWKQTRKANLAFCRVAHWTVRWTTGHCPVPDFLLEIEQSTVADCCSPGAVGEPDTVRCTPDSPVPLSSRWLSHVSRADRAADRWPGRPLAHRTVRCTPDSPVNFSRTSPDFSRERPVHRSSAWRTGHCPVHHRTVRCARLS
jgi:hypothetical protein